MESILSQFLCLISSGSHEEAVVDMDTVESQVTYTAIQGSTSEEGSEHSQVTVTILNFEDFTAGVACVPRCEYTCMVSFVGTPM